MKLLSKTNIYFVVVSLVVFCFGGVFFFLLFQLIIDRDLTSKLKNRKNYVVKQLAKSDSLLLYQTFSANTLSIVPLKGTVAREEVISDTVLYDDVEHKQIGYRQLAFQANINDSNYTIYIRRALVERKDLIKGVAILEAVLFLAFVAILALLNNQLSKRIWSPFYGILETINNYKIDRAESLKFDRTSVTEFNELSAAIEKMSGKINHEFNSQKEFTENASHEIQTPLAIIKNKMEVLLQTPQLTDEQMGLVSASLIAVNRLSKLNEALIILSRIENRQFHVVEDICINDLIENQLSSLDELIRMKRISVRKLFHERVSTKMNPFLAEMMFENLMTNAIKHNSSPGFMSITIEFNKLELSNTGGELAVHPDKLFQRFEKGSQKSQSLGLGLSIVKAVCDTYLMPVVYKFENRIHAVVIDFPKRG